MKVGEGKCASEYLADHRVIRGGNGVKDPLDALEWFLIACGDAIESLVVVLKSSTALTEKEKNENEAATNSYEISMT